MLIKCQFDPYAYYDMWGNRHLLLSQAEYSLIERWLELAYLLGAR